jgi:hypothetical protein
VQAHVSAWKNVSPPSLFFIFFNTTTPEEVDSFEDFSVGQLSCNLRDDKKTPLWQPKCCLGKMAITVGDVVVVRQIHPE